MSTSLSYRGFDIHGYRYKNSQFHEGSIIFTIEKDPSSLRCPCCKTGKVTRRGTLQGTNNKIKTPQKQAYGFQDIVFFKLKIRSLHESKARLSQMNRNILYG